MISIIGMGPGDPAYITDKAKELIEKAHRVYAFPFHLEQMAVPEEKAESIEGCLSDLPKRLDAMDDTLNLAVLVSGDPLVFSLTRRITSTLDPGKWEIIPAVGSAQILSSRLGLQSPLPEEISVHGRPMDNILPGLNRQTPMIVYTDSRNTPAEVARYMAEKEAFHWRMVIGSELTREGEKIIHTTPSELLRNKTLCDGSYDWGLNLVYLSPVEEKVKKKGFLYGIGIGPGDPELIPVKALRILKQSDVILTPSGGKDKVSIARQILESAAGTELPFQELVYPMVKDRDVLDSHWEEAARVCAELLKEGKQVSFITLGDPSLYSTFSYLCNALKEILPDARWEVIPGISSIQLAAARLGLPLALGHDRCSILPTPDDLEELKPLLKSHESIILMKVSHRLKPLKDFLAREGLSDQAAFIYKAGFKEEYKAYSFNELDDSRDGYLSIVMIRTRRSWL